jgi:hypothetical protein
LNLQTGSITTQYNVVFDDWFVAVATNASALPDFDSPQWSEFFGAHATQHIDDDEEERVRLQL